MTWKPFVYRTAVTWGDMDSAAIAYTGRFSHWILEAVEMFMRERVGADWYMINLDHKIGTPFVNMNINFRSPVTPREDLMIEVLVKRTGNSAVTCQFVGRGDKTNEYRFDAEATFVFANSGTMKKILIPAAFVARLRQEQTHAATHTKAAINDKNAAAI
jgi:acyl-CoA thioesterase FadM